jgi:uncharacterized protein (TIGR00730 family)
LTLRNICVFCGSSHKVHPKYIEATAAVGAALGKRGFRIIYGGGNVGLMGTLANAALAEGAEVIGIIPEHIRVREIQHTGLTKLHVVDTMQTRKRMMEREADAFVILPGGFGTLDEAFEIMTDKQLGLHNKPIVIYNQDGFWDPLQALVDSLIREGFAPREDFLLYKTVTEIDDIFAAFELPLHAPFDPLDKWK